jgi:hypothetical protein
MVSFSAARTTAATDSEEIPRALQYVESSQVARRFVPLLALQEMQHRAMFSRVMIRASLTMCSQEGLWRRAGGSATNSTPQ